MNSWPGWLLAVSIALAGCSHLPPDPLPGFPRLILWAWERPENLSYIAPQSTGLAFLAATLTLTGDRSIYQPRQQPLRVPPAAKLIAVVRIESAGGSPANSPTSVVDDVLRAVRRPEVSAVQIDYDAKVSERPFYRQLLAELRRRLPPEMPLEMTALVSWCLRDDWLRGLPVVEAVPMFFRMGADPHSTTERLSEPLCRSSIGISTDESYTRIQSGRRVFVFHPKAWNEADYRAVLRESAKWK